MKKTARKLKLNPAEKRAAVLQVAYLRDVARHAPDYALYKASLLSPRELVACRELLGDLPVEV